MRDSPSEACRPSSWRKLGRALAGLSEFGGSWPDGVPVQFHFMENDPWADEDLPVAREIAVSVDGAELFVYPGDKHLFADSSVADYEPEAAAALRERSLSLLARVG
jgi:dienelactone hydrolase